MRSKKKSISTYEAFIYIFMGSACIAFLFPFVYTIAISLSSPKAIMEGKVLLYPVGLTFSAYEALFQDASIINSFFFTVRLTLIGVLVSLVTTVLTAYPLSKRDLKGKNVILNFIIFTMYFSGGLIPTYLLVKDVGLIDKMGALVLPTAIDTFLLFIIINYMRGLPQEIEESAKIDGANNIRILTKIIIPLAMPVIATLTIFYAVSYWNTFFNALIYMQSSDKYPLQIRLNLILNNSDTANRSMQGAFSALLIPENLKGAIVVVTAVPILVVYPFLQRYFVKGVTIGALKG